MISTLVGGGVGTLTGPEQDRYVGPSQDHVIAAQLQFEERSRSGWRHEDFLETVIRKVIVIDECIVCFSIFSS